MTSTALRYARGPLSQRSRLPSGHGNSTKPFFSRRRLKPSHLARHKKSQLVHYHSAFKEPFRIQPRSGWRKVAATATSAAAGHRRLTNQDQVEQQRRRRRNEDEDHSKLSTARNGQVRATAATPRQRKSRDRQTISRRSGQVRVEQGLEQRTIVTGSAQKQSRRGSSQAKAAANPGQTKSTRSDTSQAQAEDGSSIQDILYQIMGRVTLNNAEQGPARSRTQSTAMAVAQKEEASIRDLLYQALGRITSSDAPVQGDPSIRDLLYQVLGRINHRKVEERKSGRAVVTESTSSEASGLCASPAWGLFDALVRGSEGRESADSSPTMFADSSLPDPGDKKDSVKTARHQQAMKRGDVKTAPHPEAIQAGSSKKLEGKLRVAAQLAEFRRGHVKAETRPKVIKNASKNASTESRGVTETASADRSLFGELFPEEVEEMQSAEPQTNLQAPSVAEETQSEESQTDRQAPSVAKNAHQQVEVSPVATKTARYVPSKAKEEASRTDIDPNRKLKPVPTDAETVSSMPSQVEQPSTRGTVKSNQKPKSNGPPKGRSEPSETQTNLFEQLFPEEAKKTDSASSKTDKEPPRIRFDPNIIAPRESFVIEPDDGRGTRVKEIAARKERLRKEYERQGDQRTILMLRKASPSLSEDDFRRLVPKGAHISEWVNKGEFVQVIPGRRYDNFARADFYVLVFKSPTAARAYQENVVRLHGMTKMYSRASPNSIVIPPPYYLVKGEDVNALLGSYTLVPPSQQLLLSMKPPPHKEFITGLLDRGGYKTALSAEGKKGTSVFLTANGPSITNLALRGAVLRDGLDRGLEWELVPGEEGIRSVEMPIEDVYDGWGLKSKGGRKTLSNSWVLDFRRDLEARRFARNWHQRPLPGWNEEERKERAPMMKAEYLW